MVAGSNRRIEATRAENKRLAEEKCRKEERIKALREAVAELQKRYEEASKGAMSAEQRAVQMDELIKVSLHFRVVISHRTLLSLETFLKDSFPRPKIPHPWLS